METLREPSAPDVTVEQRQARELTKRVRKLRWIGMEEEAAGMTLALRRLAIGGTLTTPRDTD